MTTFVHGTDGLGIAAGAASDAELIGAARGGDREAFSELYARHNAAATVVARRHAGRPADADDIVAEAFARIFRLLQEGKGPDSFFRAYLFTSVRRIATDIARSSSRTRALDNPDELAETLIDPAGLQPDELANQTMVRGAFGALPERWRSVLWYAEVEGLAPAQIAPVLGLSPNGTAALLHRAREGLRQAFLQEHLAKPLDAACRSVAIHLGAWARGALSSRERGRIDEHLVHCTSCRTAAHGVRDINKGLRTAVAPAVLGSIGLSGLIQALHGAPPTTSGLGAATGTAVSVGQTAAATHTVGATTLATQTAGVQLTSVSAGSSVAGGSSSPITAHSAGLLARLGAVKVTASLVVVGILATGGVLLVRNLANRPQTPPPPIAVTEVASSAAKTIETGPAPVVTKPELALPVVYQASGRVGVTEIGGPLTNCRGKTACEATSAAELTLPSDATVRYALLQWTTNAGGQDWTEPILTAPDGVSHHIEPADGPKALLGQAQVAQAEVTSVVARAGAGQWTVTQTSDLDAALGWSLVVAYDAASLTANQEVSVRAGAGLVAAGTSLDVDLDLPAEQTSHLGFVIWAAAPGRTGAGVWMTDSRSQGGMSQALIDSGFSGKAAGHEGASSGSDIFSIDGTTIFPQSRDGQTVEALSFRTLPVGQGESAPFNVGIITCVAPLRP